MRITRKTFLLIILFGLILNGNIFAESDGDFSVWGSGEVFKCNPILDSVIGGTGTLIYGTDLILEKGIKFNQKEFDGQIFDKDDVNAFDRFFMQSYSKPLDKVADFLMFTCVASPALFFATEDNSEWLTIGIMYTETLLLAQGIKEISKLFINRARPYMYYEGFPEKDVYEDLDWNNSCPSGHSTLAFAGATFFSYVFWKYNPESFWRFPVLFGSYAVASTVAALRVASGNHFVTDVLIGAAIGTGIGFLVPWLHTLSAGGKNDGSISNASSRVVQVGISPLGVNCRIRL